MNTQPLGLLSKVLMGIRILTYLNILLNKYFSDGCYFSIFCVADVSILGLNIKTF